MECTRCVMDATDPGLRLDAEGVCQYCHLQDQLEEQYPLGSQGDDMLMEHVHTKQQAVIEKLKQKRASSLATIREAPPPSSHHQTEQ